VTQFKSSNVQRTVSSPTQPPPYSTTQPNPGSISGTRITRSGSLVEMLFTHFSLNRSTSSSRVFGRLRLFFSISIPGSRLLREKWNYAPGIALDGKSEKY
jgi:hypothetical protein